MTKTKEVPIEGIMQYMAENGYLAFLDVNYFMVSYKYLPRKDFDPKDYWERVNELKKKNPAGYLLKEDPEEMRRGL